MGTTNDTITATSTASNVNQTIWFHTTGSASITLNGTTKTSGQTMSLACGTYDLSGSLDSGYEFSNWSNSGGSIANENSLSTTYTVNGPGTITLNVWFNPLTIPTYMQDLTASGCSQSPDGATATLMDRRDGATYTIAKINGNCWMTQNLRLSGGRTLTPADSNVASSWFFTRIQLAGNSPSYTEPQMTLGNDIYIGAYYNYCAASAGTVCQDDYAQDAAYDICPRGWRLPTYSEQNGITGTSYVSAFSPAISGLYVSGSLSGTGNGYWWSATARSTIGQYSLGYDGSSLQTTYAAYKHFGLPIRCILSN